MVEISLAVLIFTGIVMTLSALILALRSWIVGSGEVAIRVNQERLLSAPLGGNLLQALAAGGISLPGVCGGRGTCGQCRVQVEAGGGPALPTEKALMTRRDLNAGFRLACQLTLRQDARIEVPEEILGVRHWTCRVRSSRNVATFIREVVLQLPENEIMNFRAGAYVLVDCPPYRTSFREFDIEPQFRAEWDRLNLWRYRASAGEPTSRAYSMANHPGEKGIVMLNVRIATPPPGSSESVPAGTVSSYLFTLKPGDKVSISGPYGTFWAKQSNREMVFLGGGAGMAPLRSHILDQLERLESSRNMTFWYGGRNRNELFYVEDFDRLAANHENFRWFVVLSEPRPEDHWKGYTGFVHQAAFEHYLKDHPAPEDCEYYVCGPPMMNRAVLRMLDDLGVDREDIMLDEFGS